MKAQCYPHHGQFAPQRRCYSNCIFRIMNPIDQLRGHDRCNELRDGYVGPHLQNSTDFPAFFFSPFLEWPFINYWQCCRSHLFDHGAGVFSPTRILGIRFALIIGQKALLAPRYHSVGSGAAVAQGITQDSLC